MLKFIYRNIWLQDIINLIGLELLYLHADHNKKITSCTRDTLYIHEKMTSISVYIYICLQIIFNRYVSVLCSRPYCSCSLFKLTWFVETFVGINLIKIRILGMINSVDLELFYLHVNHKRCCQIRVYCTPENPTWSNFNREMVESVLVYRGFFFVLYMNL